MKKNIKTKTHNLYKIIFLFIVFLGIGYAFLEATLNINGDTTVEAPELNVYVQSTSVTSGSTSGTPSIIGLPKKEVDFTTALTNDGNSFFEETSTLINKGTKNAYLLSIEVKVYDSNDNEVTLSAPYEYSLTRADGTPVALGNLITVGSTEAYKIKFNYKSGTDMSTVTSYPSYTFKIIYNYGLVPICENNANITNLSTTKCTANENVTIGDGIVCKRAIQLHEEECSQSDASNFCSGAGYATGSTITYGNCGSSGTLTSGDAFTCDVNGDGEFNELTERFYYVSDYYNTTNNNFDTTTATLVFYNNTKLGISCNDAAYIYDASGENWHGPVDLIKGLPSIQWSNISLKTNTRRIRSENQTDHNKTSTAGGTLPSAFNYQNYTARNITAREIFAACGFSEAGNQTHGELDSCNYLMENTDFSNSNVNNHGYWIETPRYDSNTFVFRVYPQERYLSRTYAYEDTRRGARPVIDVPKSKMSY